MPSIQSRRGFLATGAATLAALAGCSVPGEQEIQESVERYDVGSATELVVTGTNGDVAVSAGSDDQVVVDVTERTRFGTEHFADVSLAARRDSETLRIDVDYAGGLDTGRVAVDLDVAVPDGLALRRAATTNGDARAEAVAGDARLETVNGDASATDVSGFVTLVSENGDVEAAGVDGLDGARTTNGEVTAEVPALKGDAAARSVNGDVTLELGAVDATLDARTDNGDVTVTGLSLRDTTTSADRVRGTLGDGTHALTARTTNGDVTVRAL